MKNLCFLPLVHFLYSRCMNVENSCQSLSKGCLQQRLYRRFLLRRVFRHLTVLILASTQVASRHFLLIVRSAISLKTLDISNCPNISQVTIFQARESLRDLQHVAISGNIQCTILTVACLCSCPNIASIEAHGMPLSPKDMLFLWQTFELVVSGEIQLETDDGYCLLLVMNTFERELFHA